MQSRSAADVRRVRSVHSSSYLARARSWGLPPGGAHKVHRGQRSGGSFAGLAGLAPANFRILLLGPLLACCPIFLHFHVGVSLRQSPASWGCARNAPKTAPYTV